MTESVGNEWLNLITALMNKKLDERELDFLNRYYNCTGIDDIKLTTPGNYGHKIPGYMPGMLITFIAQADNENEMTVEIESLGTVPLCDPKGKEFRKGSVKAGWGYTFIFDGTKFIQAGGGGAGGGGDQSVVTQDHAFPLNKLLPLHFDKETGKYILADLQGEKPCDQIGVAVDTSSINIGRHMRIEMPSEDFYSAGDCLYVSQSIPGGITIVQPDSGAIQTLGKIEKENGELVAAIDVESSFDITESNVGALLKRGTWDGSIGILPEPSLDNEYWEIINGGGILLGGGKSITVGVGDLLLCDTTGWKVVPTFKAEEFLGYVDGETNSLGDALNKLFTFASDGKIILVDTITGEGGSGIDYDSTWQEIAGEIPGLGTANKNLIVSAMNSIGMDYVTTGNTWEEIADYIREIYNWEGLVEIGVSSAHTPSAFKVEKAISEFISDDYKEVMWENLGFTICNGRLFDKEVSGNISDFATNSNYITNSSFGGATGAIPPTGYTYSENVGATITTRTATGGETILHFDNSDYGTGFTTAAQTPVITVNEPNQNHTFSFFVEDISLGSLTQATGKVVRILRQDTMAEVAYLDTVVKGENEFSFLLVTGVTDYIVEFGVGLDGTLADIEYIDFSQLMLSEGVKKMFAWMTT